MQISFPNAMPEHEGYMRQCIALAREARARGDSPVGSIVVKDGEVVGTGIEGGKTHRDVTFHAEIEAVRAAVLTLNSSDLSGCVLYTTHEPCIMCSYVIRHSRIPLVVMALTSGDKGGVSSAYPVLADTSIASWGAAPHIIAGVLAEECGAL